MARINLYAQNRHTLIIDGVQISGFAEGDFLTVKEDGNAAVRNAGADGPSMSISTKQGGNFTLSLTPVSPALGSVYSMREKQNAIPRLFNVRLLSGVDELINFEGCAFADHPQFTTGGPTMQPRQFSFECLGITMDHSATTLLG